MKQYSKNIVISSLALLLVGGFFYFNTIRENAQFVQKKPNKLKKVQRIDGAIEFWKQIRNNEVTGEIPHGAYQRANEQVNAYSRANKTTAFNINWENIGPTNMAGRVRGIMVDPDNPNRVYGGSVSGGLYRSDNSGDNWYPVHVPEENSNHAITWIAKDPINKIYYYGTGEYRFDNISIGGGTPDQSMFRGNGLYKSTDGLNFEWLPSTNPNTAVTTDPWFQAYAVHRVLCHPDSAGVIYAATNRGLLRSGDGGNTWTRMTVRLPITSPQTLVVPDIEYKKGDSVLYFTVRYSASICKLNKLNYNTGQIYETNLPNTTGSGRTEIALSDDKQTVYAITISNSTWDHTGVYRNTNRGNGTASTWQQIGPTSSSAFDLMGPNNQGFYDVSFEVTPKQQDSTEILFVGGIDLWRWNIIRGWEKISQWSIPNAYWNNPKSFGFKYEYIHADQHIVTFNPSNPNQMFVGCDGGIFRSNNRGYSFKYVPNNFVSFQFYDMDVAPDGSVLGGTQDNGSNFRSDGGNNSANKATEIIGGDGFDQYISKKKPTTGLVTSYYGALYRFAINPANGNISAGDFYDLNIDNKTGTNPGPDGLPDDGCGFKWDFICHEPHQYNGDSAYTIIGTTKGLWVTDGNTFNLGKTPKWTRVTPLSGPKAIANASCFSIPVDADSVLYVGTVGGNVYRIKYFYSGDSVKISNSITRIFNASGRYITGVAANPKNPQELYITLGSWQSGSSAPYVVKITDAATRVTLATVGSGATQLNAPGGTNGFPQIPAYCVEVNRYNTNQVFVGSELGVFASEDGGANWVSLNDFNGNTRPNGLPRVPVLSMKPRYYSAYTTIGANNVAQFVFTGETDYLYLGTHGRGWYKTTSKINSVGKDNTEENKVELNVYPNPVYDNLNLAFGLKNPASLTVQVLGLDGKLVKSMPYNAHTGNNNLQLNVTDIPTGIYLVRMTGADNKGNPINITRKVSVIH